MLSSASARKFSPSGVTFHKFDHWLLPKLVEIKPQHASIATASAFSLAKFDFVVKPLK